MVPAERPPRHRDGQGGERGDEEPAPDGGGEQVHDRDDDAEVRPGEDEQTRKHPEGDAATGDGLGGQPGQERGDGNDLEPERRVHERVGEDDGQHGQRPGTSDVDTAGDLRRPDGHRRRKRDGQDAETEGRLELTRHRRDPRGDRQHHHVQRRCRGVGLLGGDHPPVEVFGDVSGVAQRDVRVVDEAPVCDVEDGGRDQRPGNGPPEVCAPSPRRLGLPVDVPGGGLRDLGHRRGSYGL